MAKTATSPIERYWDKRLGRWMVKKPGRQAVALHSAEGEQLVGGGRGFDARAVLRRTGLTARQGARGAASAYGRAGRSLWRASELEQVGLGSFLIYAGATLVALALLRAALSGRGPAAVEKLFGIAGGGLQRLLDPRDPLFGATPSSPTDGVAPSTRQATGGRTTPSSGNRESPGFGRGEPLAGRLVAVDPHFTARAGIQLDAAVAGEAAAIAKRFGVKISSGYRSPAHNAEVHGARNSDHLRGAAADFVGPPGALSRLYRWATGFGFPYVEPMAQSKDHVHISFSR